jgi:hypothetical protein
VRGNDLIVVDDCPHCHQVHYYSTRTPDDPQYGAFGCVVDAKCADNQRRNPADRRYLLVEASAVRARARAIIRAVLCLSAVTPLLLPRPSIKGVMSPVATFKIM